MADEGLDDFFAKKDKSKKKSKSSKLTPSDILAEADKPAKKERKKKDKDKTHSSTNSSHKSDAIGLPEEEWKELEEEKEKDYSGLRIANLQISEKEEESEDATVDNDDDDDEDGENRDKKDTGQQGPWKSGSTHQTTTISTEPLPKVEETPKEESKPTGKYIPPSQRAAAAAGAALGGTSSGPTIPAHLRRKKNAPNLGSEEDFPTLGGAPPPTQFDSDSRNFERVHHGGRQMDDPSKITQQVSLGNKFSALQD